MAIAAGGCGEGTLCLYAVGGHADGHEQRVGSGAVRTAVAGAWLQTGVEPQQCQCFLAWRQRRRGRMGHRQWLLDGGMCGDGVPPSYLY